MTFFRKLYKALYGLILMIRFTRRFDSRVLEGKRIAIVGPASSAYNTNLGDFIDAFDVVIRINKAPYLLKEAKFKHDIGTRTDILFHSFFENNFSGGGPLDFALYDALGITYVVNPITIYPGYRVTFNFYKKYLAKRTVYSLPRELYREIQQHLGEFRPTIGFCALYAVLASDFSELYITGFTFFKTAFGPGYRDAFKEPDQAQKHLKDAGLHNADLEFERFLGLLKSNESKRVLMDSTLQSIVESATKEQIKH